jgi:transcriptional regulator with XRE-family HTH domain
MSKLSLGKLVTNARMAEGSTQKDFGARYGVSRAAIARFETKSLTPSLKLWMRMAQDVGLSEQFAVLTWIKARLPERFEKYVELQAAATADRRKILKQGPKGKYAKLNGRAHLLKQAKADLGFPEPLLKFLEDDEIHALYKPTGREVQALIDIFGPLGRGTKELYREALCLLRGFVEGK